MALGARTDSSAVSMCLRDGSRALTPTKKRERLHDEGTLSRTRPSAPPACSLRRSEVDVRRWAFLSPRNLLSISGRSLAQRLGVPAARMHADAVTQGQRPAGLQHLLAPHRKGGSGHGYALAFQLERLFRMTIGEPPRRCLLRIRIEHASRLLRDSHISMSEVTGKPAQNFLWKVRLITSSCCSRVSLMKFTA